MSEQKYSIEFTYRQCQVLLTLIGDASIGKAPPKPYAQRSAQFNRITSKIYQAIAREPKS